MVASLWSTRVVWDLSKEVRMAECDNQSQIDRRAEIVHGGSPLIRTYEALRSALVDRLRRGFGAACAEDAVQELFVRLLRMGPGDPARLTFNYLYVCARRVAMRLARRESRAHQVESRATAGCATAIIEVPFAEAQDPELFQLLRGLTQRERDVVRLTVLGGLTNEQAAESLGLPSTTVRGLRQRAIARVKERATACVGRHVG